MQDEQSISWWKPVLFTALAGGMGWGIRGQYGHESGAMNAGVLVSLTLCFFICRHLPAKQLVRAAAMGILAMGFGGSMTYGQTVGLTHDHNLVGNWDAFRWGFLGLFIKGGIWISFFALFLGMGLSGVRYRGRDILLVMLFAVLAFPLGILVLNMPFRPEDKVLPYLYFSDNWIFEAGNDLKPRPESWGGLFFSLSAVFVYVSLGMKDKLARNMALWGMLGGGLGFSLGQCLQAWNAWNPGVFAASFLGDIPMNWWNVMETTFGTIMGAFVALGLWLHRDMIRAKPEPAPDSNEQCIPMPLEIGLILAHVVLLGCLEFYYVPVIDFVYDFGLLMLFIPMVCIMGGRWMAYLVVFPLTLQTIAGKTLRDTVYTQLEDKSRIYNEAANINLPWTSGGEQATMHLSFGLGWFLYFILPMTISIIAALYFYKRHKAVEVDNAFSGVALMITGWSFFLLNWAIFNYPWPWQTWGGRHSNGFWFTVCMVALSVMVLCMNRTPAQAGEELSNE